MKVFGKAAIGLMAVLGLGLAGCAQLDDVRNPQVSDLVLNGETMQDGSTKTMIFDVPTLVSYCSEHMSLQPGDVISTGTPPGVGMGMSPQRFLKDGDVVSLGIEGLGQQTQHVVAYPG